MLRYVFTRPGVSRSVTAPRAQQPLESGVPRTLAGLVVVPTAATAVGMHYSSDFRATVEERLPGACEALSKITGVDYINGGRTGPTLPDHFDRVPDILQRIEKEKTGATVESDLDRDPKAVTMVKKGVKEADAQGKKVGEAVKEAAEAAAAVVVGSGGKDEKDEENSWFAFGSSEKKEETDDGIVSGMVSAAREGADASKEMGRSTANAVTAAASKVSDMATSSVRSTGDAVSSAAHNVSDSISTSTPDASDAMAAAAHDTSEAIASAAHSASDKATELSHSATDTISSAAHSASDAFLSASQSATDALSSAEDSTAAAIHELSGMASGLVEGVAGPLTGTGGAEGERNSVGGQNGGKSIMEKLASAKSAGDLGPGVIGAREGDKFSRLLGRGDFDPASVNGKEIIDVSVYKRPGWADKKSGGKPSSTAGSSDGSGLGGVVDPFSGRSDGKDGGGAATAATGEVEALQSELQSQAKWDAVRLQEAVRAQSVAEKKLAASELAMASKKHKAELAKVREEHAESARKLLEEKALDLEAEMIQRRDTEVDRLLKEREDSLKLSLESEYLTREQVAAREQEQKLVMLKASVDALHEDLDKSHSHRQASRVAGSVAASAFALKDALQGNGPFERELEMASRNSELGTLVAASIPVGAGKKGVPTVEELKGSFSSVAKEGRKAALVPEGDVGTIWGHLLASIVSRVKCAVDSGNRPFVPSTDEERILLAEKQISAGNLQRGIDSLGELSGLAADITSDWVQAANARIAADLGAQALLADAILSQQVHVSEPEGAECSL